MNTASKKSRVCMFSHYFPPHYSGAAKQAISLAHQLKKRGHSIEFITVKWPGLEAEDNFEGFPVHRVESGHGRRHKELRLWWNLFQYVLRRRKDFDILHSHGAYYTNSIIGPLARLAGWKSLVKASLANNDLHGLGASLTGKVHYRFLKLVDAYIAISRELGKEFLSTGLPARKVHYIPNGVDIERFHPTTPEERLNIRRMRGLPEKKKIALTIGVFDQRKNIGWLLKEWVRKSAFGTGAMLLAIGPQSREDVDGSFLGSLRKMAEENPDILYLMDHVNDIERYYRAADLFILPSYSEGMPNVVLEAMASGLPCAVTQVSGSEELVQDGETGYTFRAGDTEGLCEAIQKILSTTDTEGGMGARARRLIEEKYAVSIVAERYEELYQRLINSN